MKVLVLSSNNGGGHNSAAKAIQECYESHGDICEIRDCLSFISDGVSEAVARSHNFVYRHAPKFFNNSYRHTEQNTAMFKDNHAVRRMIDLGKYNLGQFLQTDDFELVICTHVFAAMMLTAAKQHYDLPIRTAIVETDYTNTPGSSENDVDYHFLPDTALSAELIAAGVDESRIVISGIPVRQEFTEGMEKAEAKQLLGMPVDRPHVLIMGGSMGSGPIPDILDSLYLLCKESIQISVVCGTNEQLLTVLRRSCGHLGIIHLYGYTPHISLLMDSADLLVTKPGGISTSEAAAKGLPMVLINTVGGCEEHNLSYFLQKGGAVTADTAEELCHCCQSLLNDAGLREKMSRALKEVAKPDAAETIYGALSAVPVRTNDIPANPRM